jgi:hypothetical protein
LLAASALALVVPAAALAPPPAAEPLVTIVGRPSGAVEASNDGTTWAPVQAGASLKNGTMVRTGEAGRLVLRASGESLVLGSSSRLVLEPSRLVLHAGRIEWSGGATVSAGSAAASGQGQAVVRAASGAVYVSVLDGEFTVRAGAGVQALAAGQGAIAREGAPIEGPLTLLAAPSQPTPGSDPVYVRQGRAVRLAWNGTAAQHRVSVYDVASAEALPLRQAEAGRSSASLAVDSPGLYRWQVEAIDPRGLEPSGSAGGRFCVVER